MKGAKTEPWEATKMIERVASKSAIGINQYFLVEVEYETIDLSVRKDFFIGESSSADPKK